MRRASPSPGTPFSVLTGPTSGSLRWPVLHFFHTPVSAMCSPASPVRCRGRESLRPVSVKPEHMVEVVARRFFSGHLALRTFP
jgi:hypothetical protein